MRTIRVVLAISVPDNQPGTAAEIAQAIADAVDEFGQQGFPLAVLGDDEISPNAILVDAEET